MRMIIDFLLRIIDQLDFSNLSLLASGQVPKTHATAAAVESFFRAKPACKHPLVRFSIKLKMDGWVLKTTKVSEIMKSMIVIPARLASSRLSEKLLLRAGGKSVLQHTYEASQRANVSERIVVAADDPRLVAEVNSFGGEARLTSMSCQSGTDRIAEIALQHDDIDVFVNVQGDEPEIAANVIDAVASLLATRPDADIATAACAIDNIDQLEDPACVKVVMGSEDRAIYFSRSAVPCARDGLTDALLHAQPPVYWQHIGLYAYRREFLLWFATQSPGRLEEVEKLEQLRAIEAGKTIVVTSVGPCVRGIDTLEDFRAFRDRIEA